VLWGHCGARWRHGGAEAVDLLAQALAGEDGVHERPAEDGGVRLEGVAERLKSPRGVERRTKQGIGNVMAVGRG
jgi:hypothetical protein